MCGRILGSHRDRFLCFGHRGSKFAKLRRAAGEQELSSHVFGTLLQNCLCTVSRFSELSRSKYEIREIELRLHVAGIKVNREGKFAVRVWPVLKAYKAFRELVAGGRKILVDLNRILKLDGRFLIFTLLSVLLSAGEIFLLSDIGISEATGY